MAAKNHDDQRRTWNLPLPFARMKESALEESPDDGCIGLQTPDYIRAW